MTADSFKADLATFRKHIEQGPLDETKTLILNMLDRWAKRERTWEEVWKRMGEILPLRPPAALFIASVIQTRRLSDDAIRTHANFPRLLDRAESAIEHEWNSPTGNFVVAGVKKELLGEAKQAFDGFDQALGREKLTAQKRKFVELWSDHFREHTGKPADEIVAAITEIAFGGKVDVTDVQDALKFRKRRGKDTRKQK